MVIHKINVICLSICDLFGLKISEGNQLIQILLKPIFANSYQVPEVNVFLQLFRVQVHVMLSNYRSGQRSIYEVNWFSIGPEKWPHSFCSIIHLGN